MGPAGGRHLYAAAHRYNRQMTPPRSIAHYRITAKLGEGGMGSVYRATDTKLNREVAVKILPEAFAQDTLRTQRFVREAQLLASLNHPNIAAVHGVEEGAIVMELVEGADLSGPVSIDTAIAYAKQIAAGLEAAHEKGIVHRDLKPANIKVTPDGTVKLLDFGLAKATEQSALSPVSPTMSPTLSLAMTQAGMILGTAAYMSPEQARGYPVDRRADIWAFGVILFELLTGKHLYGGAATVTDTLAAVVLKEPDYAALPADTPRRVSHLIERCLRKDPKLRLRDIGDARLALDEAELTTAGDVAARAPRRAWLPWTVSAIALAALAAGLLWMRPWTAAPSPAAMRFLVPLPPGTLLPSSSSATEWVPSPDGRNLAMVVTEGSKNALWVRPLGATAAHRLDKTEDADFPFWSPDSQSIGFFTGNSLKRVSVSGGAVQTVCPVSPGAGNSSGGNGGAWSKDGFIVFAVSSGKPLMRVPAMGGLPAPITALEQGEFSHEWPQLLPDGRHVLYLARSRDAPGIYVQELGSKKRIRVLQTATRAIWAPPGYLLFGREGTLFAQRLNLKTFQLEGEPLSVATDVQINESTGRNTFAVSQTGVLVYRTGSGDIDHQLNWRDRAGKVLNAVGKRGPFRTVSLSPDGKSAALDIGSLQALDVWVMDLASGVLTPMTRDGNVSIYTALAWSPDSERLAFSPGKGGVQEITVASGKIAVLSKEPTIIVQDWSPDGRSILGADIGGTRLSLLSLEDGFPVRPILTTAFRQAPLRFSPDGKFVAYDSVEADAEEIYVASFPSFSVKRRVSTGGGSFPAWAQGGKELFYRSADGMLMDVEMHLGSTIEAGIPKPLFRFGSGTHGNRFAVMPDGQRFLMNEPVQNLGQEVPELTLVINWAAELKQ